MAYFNQAIQWLKEGKKIRRNNWSKELYIYVPETDSEILWQNDCQNDCINLNDIEASDWEIYANVGKVEK